MSENVSATAEAILQFLAFIVGDTSDDGDAAPEPTAIPKGFRSELAPGGGAAGAAAPSGADDSQAHSADVEQDVAGVSAQLERSDLSAGAHARLPRHSAEGRNEGRTGAACADGNASGTSSERGAYAAGMGSPAAQNPSDIRTDEHSIVLAVESCVNLLCKWTATASGPLEQGFLALLPKLCDWAAAGPQEPPPVPTTMHEGLRIWDTIADRRPYDGLRKLRADQAQRPAAPQADKHNRACQGTVAACEPTRHRVLGCRPEHD